MSDQAERKCGREGCDRKHYGKDLCKNHYIRERNKRRYHSDPEYRAKVLEKTRESLRTRRAKRRAEDPGHASG
jgi:hypothetical protein